MNLNDLYTESTTLDYSGGEPVSVEHKAVPRKLANMSSEHYGYASVDVWGTIQKPDKDRLINEYKRVPYTCANLNANGFADVKLRLYVKTNKSDKKPRVETRKLSKKSIDRLCSREYLSKYTKDFVNIDEVIDHPALDLLAKVNEEPLINGRRLNTLTQLYQEITGVAYWFIVRDALGRPSQIWLIPSQYLKPRKLQGSKNLVDYYEFQAGMGGDNPKYSPDEIIPFLMPCLFNPYLAGMSPLEASLQAVRVSNKLIAHEDNFLQNEARPDGILTPEKDAPITKEIAANWERAINAKFGRGQAGKVLVAEEALKFTPLTFSPRDVARLEINAWTKLEICNAFSVPLALVEGQNINRQTLEAALTQHAIQAIRPRCENSAAVLNDQYISNWDDSGRLFLAYDEAVPENEELKVTKVVQLVQAGILTPNEGREEFMYAPIAGGDELTPINASNGENERQNKRDNGDAKK